MNEAEYIYSFQDLKDQLVAIRAILTALRTNAASAATKADIEQYRLDTGQTIIWTTYRSQKEIGEGIRFWLQEEQRVLHEIEGHGKVLKNCRCYY